MSIPAHRSVSRTAWRNGAPSIGTRAAPEETPLALSFGGSTIAVMMGTPAALEDFAVGFCLNEGIVTNHADILSVTAVEADGGIDLQIDLADNAAEALKKRRRAMAGPVGCGLCGVESIEAALRKPTSFAGATLLLTPADIRDAVASLADRQPLHAMTHAVHAAGFFGPGEGVVAVREDVGRHNALDKLCGALARSGRNGGAGAVVVTSRVSVEMVQKTAACGSSFILAVSAPTALAIRAAEEANITLVALVRGADFDVYTHHNRIVTGARAHVA
ncbi:MAG TPA: formate dehydrogenase accessory sulfurtransferase FdhD [Rhizobiaceae bacterium]|nr:formate dehydrogenase accessory sulfurtransferase FdhD [Rhizobiaceae bacterium]